MAFTLVTTQVIIARNAGALYGLEVGNANMTSYVAQIGSNVDGFLNTVYANSVGTTSTTTVADVLVANLGISGDAAIAAAKSYIVGQLNAVAYTARGAVVNSMLSAFSGMTSDATFGAFATAYNTKIANAVTYAATTGSADGTWAGVSGTTTTGQAFVLTTGLDAPASGAFATNSPVGNATINALLDGANSTLTGLDNIAATGTGNKLALAVTDDSTNLPIFNMSGVQTVDIRSSEGVGQGSNAKGLDFSQTGVTGLQTVNVTEAYDNVTLTVGGTTAVNVSGLASGNAVDVTAKTGAVNVTAKGDVAIAGGSTQVVSTQGGVDLSGATGNVSVTNSKQGTSSIAVMDGANVSVTTTYAAASGNNDGFVGVGTATYQPNAADEVGAVTGAIDITVNATGSKIADKTTGEIYTYGGSSVDIKVNATQAVNDATSGGAANSTVTQDYIMVLGTADTKTVSVTQTAAVTAKDSIKAVADVAEVDKVTFKALSIGDSATVAGLTFTATEATTAAQTAAAFANLADGATHGSSIKGIYSGSVNGWTSGAVSTASVSFTSVAYDSTDVSASGSSAGVTPTVTQTTDGVDGHKAQAGVGGIETGWVDVASYDVATDDWVAAPSVEKIHLTNFNGTWIWSDAVSDVTLTNGTNTMYIDSGMSAINVTVDGIDQGNLLINESGYDGLVQTLNLTVTGADSVMDIEDDADTVAISALNIKGDAALDLTDGGNTALAGLKTVTINGSVSVTAGAAFTGSHVTSVTSTTTGDVSAEINGDLATYSGGSGVDDITLWTASRYLKSVSLGGGDDTLTLANDTAGDFAKTVIATGVTLDGGTGTNTLSLAPSDLDNITSTDTTKVFASHLKNFSVLDIQTDWSSNSYTVDLAKLTNTANHVAFSHVVTNGNDQSVTLNNLASGGTVEATDYTSWLDVGVVGASTQTVSLNLVVSGDNDFYFGANGVETVTVTSTNTSTSGVDSNYVYVYDDLDQLSTVVVNGDADIQLETDYNTASSVTLVDASELTGALSYSTGTEGGVTVLGGSGDDNLAARGDGDILSGGAGNDVLDANNGAIWVEMTGGEGNDIFMVNDSIDSADADVAAPTIMDAQAGDSIQLGATGFVNTAFAAVAADTLADNVTAILADLADDEAGWFEYAGDTYVVVDRENADGPGKAIVAHLIGTIDLSTATFSSNDGNYSGLLYIA